MSGIRKAFRRSQRESKKRRGQLSPREDDVFGILRRIKEAVDECKEFHMKYDNSVHLTKANQLISCVDEYRQQLGLSEPKSKEIDKFKAHINQLARERDDAEYRHDEDQLTILSLQMQSQNEQKEKENLKKQIANLQEDNLSLKQIKEREINFQNNIGRLEKDLVKEREAKEEAIGSLNQLKARERNLQNKLERIQKDLAKGMVAKEEAVKSKCKSQLKEDNVRETIDRLQRNLSAEREAKRDALIGAAANTTVCNNYPSDLSDPNRPMKLAEKVSELYDNEWTDAMENLENDMDEQAAIKFLLDIIANVYITFEDIGDAQTECISSLALSLAVPDIEDLQNIARSSLMNTERFMAFLQEVTTSVMNYRKENYQEVASLLYKVMKSRLARVYCMDEKAIKACDEFIQNTVKYVWMMRVQDPPVHMEWDFSRGEKFDHDILRSYTKGGDSVDYVVWPVLYLHKGGPMLSKGVAQGLKSKPK